MAIQLLVFAFIFSPCQFPEITFPFHFLTNAGLLAYTREQELVMIHLIVIHADKKYEISCLVAKQYSVVQLHDSFICCLVLMDTFVDLIP